MKKVLDKLATARAHIKSHPLKKDGKNSFSNYDYFSPELVGKMVNDACIEANLICVFNLKKDDLGYYGELLTTDLESGETITSIMRTEKPVIKATNETQQMGGMNTYTKRYCLMSLFDIEDNTMDYDSDSSNKTEKKANGSEVKKDVKDVSEDDKLWLNEGTPAFDAAVRKLSTGGTTIAKIRAVMKVSKKTEEALLQASGKTIIQN